MTEPISETPDYESMITELKNIAKQLDDPSTTVEDAVQLHRRGMELIARCEDFLTKAEMTITEVRKSEPSA